MSPAGTARNDSAVHLAHRRVRRGPEVVPDGAGC